MVIVLEDHYVPFGYGEVIGYIFTAMVYDKDGIGVTVAFLMGYKSWLQKEKQHPQKI